MIKCGNCEGFKILPLISVIVIVITLQFSNLLRIQMKQANNQTKTISEEYNNHMKNVHLPWFNFEKTYNSSTLNE